MSDTRTPKEPICPVCGSSVSYCQHPTEHELRATELVAEKVRMGLSEDTDIHEHQQVTLFEISNLLDAMEDRIVERVIKALEAQ